MGATRLRWRTFAIALAAIVTVAGLIWILFPPLYLTNDDVTIRLGIEGRLVPGQPATGFLVMTHAALAWVLVWLQRFVPLPLWDLTITGTLACAVAVILALCWPPAGSGWLRYLIVASALGAGVLPLLEGLQFTISATVAGAAAVALALVELDAPRPRPAVLLAGALLLLIGALIRPMGAVAGVLALVVVLAPIAVLTSAGRLASVARLAAVGAVALVLYVSLQYADTLLYRLDPEWDAYRTNSWMLSRLFEWGGRLSPADVDAMQRSAGWSRNDWELLPGWFAVDPDVFGVGRISTAYQASVARVDGLSWLHWLGERFTLVDVAAIEQLLRQLAPAVVIAIATAVASGNARTFLSILAGAALMVGLCLAIEIPFKDLPLRLIVPLQFCMVCGALLTAATARETRWPVVAVAAASVLIALGVHQYRALARGLSSGVTEAADIDAQAREFEQRLKPSLVILHADAFPSEVFWRPFMEAARGIPAIRLGENNQSPHLQRFLSISGRQPLLRALCQDPSMVIVTEEGRLQGPTVYLREHFGMEVSWQQVYEKSFRAWRCSAASPDAANGSR